MTRQEFQRYAMEVLEGSPHHKMSHYVELMISSVVIVNCACVILDSVPSVHADYKDYFHFIEVISVFFFTIEYIMRVWTLGLKYGPTEGGAWRGRRGYIFSPFGLVDFFATMPFYFHFIMPSLDLRILRVLRLLRILKLSKYNTALQDLFGAVYSERRAFGSAGFLLLIATVISASLMHFAEGHEQPKYFESIPHAIYWSIVTITSGYGNVEPVTMAGEIIAISTGFLGVCMAAIMTGIVASAFATQLSRKKAAYAQQLQKAMEDGTLSDEEKASLDKLKAQFGLTDRQVREISPT
ncbi:MAG: ion transporter [Alphaproteobacteria bacterium]|jgi:voltage-gated potassium channel